MVLITLGGGFLPNLISLDWLEERSNFNLWVRMSFKSIALTERMYLRCCSWWDIVLVKWLLKRLLLVCLCQALL